MDSDGMTRAWPTAPLMSSTARTTQNQATTSRHTFCSLESGGSMFLLDFASGAFCLRFFLTFTFHHHRSVVGQFAEARSLSYFQLDQIGRVVPRITRRTEIALGVVDGLAQTGKGDVAEGIGSQKAADIL